MLTLTKRFYQGLPYLRRMMMVLAYGVILLAVLSNVFRALTPFAAQYKPQLEQILSQRMKIPVTIHELETGWYWFEPMIRAKQVHIGGEEFKGVKIRELDLGLDVLGSFWHRRIQPGLMILDGAHVSMHQSPTGWILDELPLTSNHSEKLSLNELASIVLNHQTIQLKHINLNILVDPVVQKNWMILGHCSNPLTPNGRPDPMEIGWSTETEPSVMDLFSHTWSYHEVKHQVCPSYLHWPSNFSFKDLNLTLISHYGSYQLSGYTQSQYPQTALRIGAEFIVDPDHLDKISGHGYLSWEKIQVPGLINQFLHASIELKHADVAGELWLNFNSGQLNRVSAHLDASQIVWKSAQFKRVGHLRQIAGHLNWGRRKEGYELVSDHVTIQDDHGVWPLNSWMYQTNGDRTQQELFIESIDVARWLSLPLPWPEVLKPYLKMNLKGRLSNIHWTAVHQQWRILAAFDQLGWDQTKSLPGVKNLKGVVSLQPNLGHVALDSQNLEVNISKYPRLIFSLLNLDLAWHRNEQGTQYQLNHIQWIHPHARFTGQAQFYNALDTHNSNLDIHGRYELHEGEFWLPFLPQQGMKPKLYHWLRYDIHHINTAIGQVNVQGKLRDFPFDDPRSGTFKIDAYLKDIDLDYAPHWPEATAVQGYLSVDSRRLTARIESAKLRHTLVDALNLSVDDLGLDHERLLIHGRVKKAYAQQAWDIVVQSPLGMKNPIFSNMSWQGSANLDLMLDIPLYPQDDEILLKGIVGLNQCKLHLDHPYVELKADHVQGDLNFDQTGLNNSQLKAQLWHHETPIQIVRNPQTTHDIQLLLRGQLTSTQLLETLKLSDHQQLFGKTMIDAVLSFPLEKHQPQTLTLTSDLRGLGWNLDPFWVKLKKMIMPMRTQLIFPGNGQFKFLASLDAPQMATPAGLFQPKFDVSRDMVGLWTANIHLPLMKGQVNYNSQQHLLSAQFKELSLPHSSKAENHDSSKDSWKLNQIPRLHIEVESFNYHDLALGKLSLSGALKSQDQWTLDDWSLKSNDYEFTGHGLWRQTKSKNQSELTVDAKAKDVKNLLQALKFPPVLEKGKMDVHADLVFHVSPWKIKLDQMNGQLHGKISNGRTMTLSRKTESKLGIIKILSILSLQTIPRRLQLDFSDLSHDGYTFDEFDGKFQLHQGVLQTEQCTLDGPVITTEITGRVDLVEQVYDLTARIAPQLTSSLPVVATIAGGPVVGAATWLVNRVVNKGMQKIASYTYRITGPWSDPVVEPLKFQRPMHH